MYWYLSLAGTEIRAGSGVILLRLFRLPPTRSEFSVRAENLVVRRLPFKVVCRLLTVEFVVNYIFIFENWYFSEDRPARNLKNDRQIIVNSFSSNENRQFSQGRPQAKFVDPCKRMTPFFKIDILTQIVTLRSPKIWTPSNQLCHIQNRHFHADHRLQNYHSR